MGLLTKWEDHQALLKEAQDQQDPHLTLVLETSSEILSRSEWKETHVLNDQVKWLENTLTYQSEKEHSSTQNIAI